MAVAMSVDANELHARLAQRSGLEEDGLCAAVHTCLAGGDTLA
jgi:hypothetical protein